MNQQQAVMAVDYAAQGLTALRIWPPEDHPVYQISPEVAPWAPSFDQQIVTLAESYGLLSGDVHRAHLAGSRHGELAARAYPGALAPQREVIALWFTWIFFLDDFYDGALGHQEDGHADIVSQMLAMMPMGPVPPPRASWPLLRVLGDTWRATGDCLSLAWRMRFRQHIHEFLASFRYESLHRARGTVPPSGVFEQLRRPASSVPACLDLLEYVAGAEIPPLIYRTDQFQALHNAAVDVVAWINDVASLRKELRAGELNSSVLIFQRDQGCTTQQAIDLVYERVARDVGTFLRAEDELRQLCEQWTGLTAAELDAVTECATGMRRWMRGSLDWSRNSARYR
jgi:hypothetical protein